MNINALRTAVGFNANRAWLKPAIMAGAMALTATTGCDSWKPAPKAAPPVETAPLAEPSEPVTRFYRINEDGTASAFSWVKETGKFVLQRGNYTFHDIKDGETIDGVTVDQKKGVLVFSDGNYLDGATGNNYNADGSPYTDIPTVDVQDLIDGK